MEVRSVFTIGKILVSLGMVEPRVPGESRRQKMEGEGPGSPSAQVSQGGACSLTGDEKT